jgi:hypothetical protein
VIGIGGLGSSRIFIYQYNCEILSCRLRFAKRFAFAQTGPAYLNISGGLFNPNGIPIELTSVGFQIQLMDPAGTCVLYSEEHLAQDLSQTKGAFSFQLGTGTSQVNHLESSTSFDGKLFLNSGNMWPSPQRPMRWLLIHCKAKLRPISF